MRYNSSDMRTIIDVLSEDIDPRHLRRNGPWRERQDAGSEYVVSVSHPTGGEKTITVHATSPYEALMVAQEELRGSGGAYPTHAVLAP